MTRDVTDEIGDILDGARAAAVPRATAPLVNVRWTPEQLDAVERIVRWRLDPGAPRLMSLTGPAGAGKTTVMRAVRDRLYGTRTAWAAMTGKAAARMKEATGLFQAKTLHSVLFHPPREVDRPDEQRVDLEFDQLRSDGRSCLLVVDEASMIGPRLCGDIERSRYDKVLFVGDPYQIPPVTSRAEESSSGEDYSVFADVPGPHLETVMRAQGAVLAAATYVRKKQLVPVDAAVAGGSEYSYHEDGDGDAALKRALASWFEDPQDHVVITWRNEVRMLASRVVRMKLGRSGLPQPGEPMVVRRNVYGTGLMNGDVVTVDGWGAPGPTLEGVETRWCSVTSADGDPVELLALSTNFTGQVPYVPVTAWRRAIAVADVPDPTPLTWGYCLTGHLAQGSEYRRVTVLLPGDFNSSRFTKQTRLPDGSHMRFSMRFLYTSLARAKVRASLISSPCQ